MSSDGIQRLDLDLEDALIANGNHHASVGTETPKQAIQVPMPPSKEATNKQSGSFVEEETLTEPEVSQQKNVIRPPMPPTQEVVPSTTGDEPDKDDGLVKKVCIMLFNSCPTMQKYFCISLCLDNIANEI